MASIVFVRHVESFNLLHKESCNSVLRCKHVVSHSAFPCCTQRFTEFGGTVHERPVEDLAFAVARFIQKGGSFINYYMVIIFIAQLSFHNSIWSNLVPGFLPSQCGAELLCNPCNSTMEGPILDALPVAHL